MLIKAITILVLCLSSVWVAISILKERRQQKGRLKAIQDRFQANGVDITPLSKGGRFDKTDKVLCKYLPRISKLTDRLKRAGLTWGPTRYYLISATVTIATFGYLFVHKELAGGLSAFAGVIAGLTLPYFFVSAKIKGRKKLFIVHFPEAIDLIVRGLKSGLPITESIKTIATEIQGPVAEEFEKVGEELKLGRELSDILWDTSKKLNLPEFDFFVIALSIQRETGGNLAETLENLVDVLRRRKQVEMKIKAMSSEAKASAYIIGSLPFIMYVMLWQMNPDYMSYLVDDSRGIMLTAAALFFVGLGAMVMRKMVRFEI